MELEAADAVVARSAAAPRSTASGRCGSTDANGISTSAFAAATSAISSFGTAGAAGLRLGVDGEDDGGHVALAVVRGDVLDRRRARPRRSTSAAASRHSGGSPSSPVAPDLGVGVDVDRDDRCRGRCVTAARRRPSLITASPSPFERLEAVAAVDAPDARRQRLAREERRREAHGEPPHPASGRRRRPPRARRGRRTPACRSRARSGPGSPTARAASSSRWIAKSSPDAAA